LGRLYQQERQQCVALLGDVSEAPRVRAGIFTRNQSQVAAKLFAATKALRHPGDESATSNRHQ
jgi:hypothetical protein